MADNDNVTSFFDRLGGTTPTAQEPATPAADLTEYRAAVPFLADEERLNILVYQSNGDQRLVSTIFNDLVSVAPDRFAYIYSNGVIYIRGHNVRALLSMFQFRTVKELHPFDETRHKQPDGDAPIIDTIDWRSREDILAELAGR